jgi:hypothetical protein
MDMSYAIISTHKEYFSTLYREPIVRYQVEDPQNPMIEIMYLDNMIGNFFTLTNSITQEE